MSSPALADIIATREVNRYALYSFIAIAVLVVGFGGWAGTTTLSGALIASGSVVVDSNVKKVQHPTGGIVGDVRVREGDNVKLGDLKVGRWRNLTDQELRGLLPQQEIW